ncbi:MAG: MarR family transcriptional regulator, partial [Verrucomicrobia bacterium]
MPSSTVENYIKTIYQLADSGDRDALVAMGDIAATLNVVPGTATSMVKTLADAGLVDY